MIFDIRPAIESYGLERFIELVGVRRIIEHIGMDRFIEHFGVKKVIERMGLDCFIASLLPRAPGAPSPVAEAVVERRPKKKVHKEDSASCDWLVYIPAPVHSKGLNVRWALIEAARKSTHFAQRICRERTTRVLPREWNDFSAWLPPSSFASA